MGVRERVIMIATPFIIRGLKGVSTYDSIGKAEFDKWPEGLAFTMAIATAPKVKISFIKREGQLERNMESDANNPHQITIVFKDAKYLLNILLGRTSASKAFAENRLYVSGDLRMLVSVLSVIDQLFAHLYPKLLLKKMYIKIPLPAGKRRKVMKSTILKH